MTAPTERKPLKKTIPPDLQRQVEDMRTKVPRNIGQPGDLDEEKQRWLIVGICLHSIISPMLRKYVDTIVSTLYNSLVLSHSIDTQGYPEYLENYPPTKNYRLTYETINNNRKIPKTKMYNKWINDYKNYDYKITNHVDFSKLFLQPNMTHYSAIDESCDSSALLGMIINISTFPPAVQTDAEKILSDIRNPCAHCDFREWTAAKYSDSFQLMKQLVKDLGLSSMEENKILGELDTWATNGQNFLSGTRLGLEILNEIHQQTHILSEYMHTLCTETDSQFIKVHKELKDSENSLKERIRHLENTNKEQDKELNKLKEETKKHVEDHIPKHIRDQHGQEISEWEQDQTSFVKTRATDHILGALLLDNCIVVTGSSGCGKSSNIHHVALFLRDEFGYEIIPSFTGPTDIINYYNKNTKQVFVVDDICGKDSINTQMLQMWRDYSERMEKYFKTVENKKKNINNSKMSDPKLLISCRLHIYKEKQFQHIALLTRKECNLLSTELCLLPRERMLIAQKYCSGGILYDVMRVNADVAYFPLLCKLSKNKNYRETIDLFTAPLSSIRENINHIISANKMHFCALVLCILFDDGFNTNLLKLKSAPERKKLEDIVKEFGIDLNTEMSRNTLKSSFTTLDGTFIKQRGPQYRLIHDIIYKLTALICGQNLTECFIKYAPSTFIRDYFSFESEENGDLIYLSDDQDEEYFERLLRDLRDFVLTSTFHNQQLKYKSFIDRLIRFLNCEEVKLLLKEIDTKGCEVKVDGGHKYKTTPLIESAEAGYYDITHFLIVTVQCNVNNLDLNLESSLFKASKGGHSDIVQLLLENNADVSQCNCLGIPPLHVAYKRRFMNTLKLLINADVSQCNSDGESLLFLACEKADIKLVKLLLQNNADVSQCNKYEMSPLCLACKNGDTDTVKLLLHHNADVNRLYGLNKETVLHMACSKGHTDTVKLLLQNNADVSQCNYRDESPLYVACERGYTHIVNLLLQNNADVSQCANFGISPLFVAFQRGHTDTFELLIKNNANVSQCNVIGESILFLACYRGNKDIVNMLLQNNADVSQCICTGESPLYVACERGDTYIVNLLLQKKADISQCVTGGQSALHVACNGGYTDIVKLFIQNDCDVSKCNNDGESALHVACKRGHTDIVDMLLQNNADISVGDIWGMSPLYAACLSGHTEIVQLLIQSNADVSQCNIYGAFPLYAACRGGHTDTVKLLLQNNADLSKCNRRGLSPLYLACKHGYTDLVKLLLGNHADVSQCKPDGQSPLHVACDIDSFKHVDKDSFLFTERYNRNIEIVKLLLAANANVELCNKKGQTPLDVARKSNLSEIVTLLEENRRLKE